MKVKKIVLGLICSVIAGLGMISSGCGTDMSDSAYCGTWKADKAVYSEIETDASKAAGGKFRISLNEDGTCELSVGKETQTGTWVETENGVCINEDKAMTLNDEDGKLILKYGEMTVKFKKNQ